MSPNVLVRILRATEQTKSIWRDHVIMEVRSPRISAVGKLETQESDGMVPVQVWRLKTQKEPMFQFEVQLKQPDCSSLLLEGGSAFLFHSGLWLIWLRPTHIREGRQLSLPIQILTSSKNTFKDMPRIIFDQIPGHPCDPVTFAQKITLDIFLTASSPVLGTGETG